MIPAKAKGMADFSYDQSSARYRNNETGQYVSVTEVRAAVDTVIDNSGEAVTTLSQRLITGDITLSEWRDGLAATLKALHVAAGVAASGGFASTSASDYGFIGSQIKKQYEYLNGFASDIASGKQALDGSLLARAEMYAESARGTFSEVELRANVNAGNTLAKRVLGNSNSCGGCVDAAGQGWMPIDEMPPIGSLQCLSRCHCSIVYRK